MEYLVDTIRLSFSAGQIRVGYICKGAEIASEVAPVWLALGLCDVCVEDMIVQLPDSVLVEADWPVNFGRAKRLESRMEKAIMQAPVVH